jgi:Tfp pilus assembly protein PilO
MNPRLELELLARRYGWLPLALPAALLAAGIVFAFWPAAPAPAATVQPMDNSRQIAERYRVFHGVLIDQQALAERQRNVLETAQRHGLTLGRIDYGYDSHPAGRFGLAILQVPVRGTYAEFRAFLASILASQPALALDDLSIRRLDDGIEAQLRLAFHTSPAPGARP